MVGFTVDLGAPDVSGASFVQQGVVERPVQSPSLLPLAKTVIGEGIKFAERKVGETLTEQLEALGEESFGTPEEPNEVTEVRNRIARLNDLDKRGALPSGQFKVRAESMLKKAISRSPAFSQELRRVHSEFVSGDFVKSSLNAADAQIKAQQKQQDQIEKFGTQTFNFPPGWTQNPTFRDAYTRLAPIAQESALAKLNSQISAGDAAVLRKSLPKVADAAYVSAPAFISQGLTALGLPDITRMTPAELQRIPATGEQGRNAIAFQLQRLQEQYGRQERSIFAASKIEKASIDGAFNAVDGLFKGYITAMDSTDLITQVENDRKLTESLIVQKGLNTPAGQSAILVNKFVGQDTPAARLVQSQIQNELFQHFNYFQTKIDGDPSAALKMQGSNVIDPFVKMVKATSESVNAESNAQTAGMHSTGTHNASNMLSVREMPYESMLKIVDAMDEEGTEAIAKKFPREYESTVQNLTDNMPNFIEKHVRSLSNKYKAQFAEAGIFIQRDPETGRFFTVNLRGNNERSKRLMSQFTEQYVKPLNNYLDLSIKVGNPSSFDQLSNFVAEQLRVNQIDRAMEEEFRTANSRATAANEQLRAISNLQRTGFPIIGGFEGIEQLQEEAVGVEQFDFIMNQLRQGLFGIEQQEETPIVPEQLPRQQQPDLSFLGDDGDFEDRFGNIVTIRGGRAVSINGQEIV